MKTIFMVFRKELIEIFRDRGTLIILLIPLLIFPILNAGLGYINKDFNKEINVCIKYDTQNSYDLFENYISQDTAYEINIINTESPKEALKKGDVDCYILVLDKTYSFIYNSSSYDSLSLTTKLSEEFQSFYNEILEETNNEVCHIDLVDESGGSMNIISSITVPIILVMLLFQNTSSFSNDMFAGEKERKTLELLLLSGTKTSSIYCGKALALLTLSMTSLTLSFGSYFLTFNMTNSGIKQFKFMINGNVQLNIICIILCAILLSIIAVFLSISVSLVSKNMKNSQILNELILAIPIGVMALLVLGIIKHNSLLYSFIPVFNLLVNFKEAFVGNINLSNILISIVTNILFIILIMCLSIRYMNSEKILQ